MTKIIMRSVFTSAALIIERPILGSFRLFSQISPLDERILSIMADPLFLRGILPYFKSYTIDAEVDKPLIHKYFIK